MQLLRKLKERAGGGATTDEEHSDTISEDIVRELISEILDILETSQVEADEHSVVRYSDLIARQKRSLLTIWMDSW